MFVVYVYPPYFILADIIFIIIHVGELIFSGETVEVIVYENAQIIYPLIASCKRTHGVCCVLVCRQNNYIILLWGFLWPKEQYVFLRCYATFHFLWSQILSMISYICIVGYTL
jgi:hypothetical protein